MSKGYTSTHKGGLRHKPITFRCDNCNHYDEKNMKSGADDDSKTMTCTECGNQMDEFPWKANAQRCRIND